MWPRITIPLWHPDHILHRSCLEHQYADGLSTIPDREQTCECYYMSQNLTDLHCMSQPGGCTYCTRAHTQWARFEEDVDDVIPLAIRSVTLEAVKPGVISDTSLVRTITGTCSQDSLEFNTGIFLYSGKHNTIQHLRRSFIWYRMTFDSAEYVRYPWNIQY